MCAYTCTRIIVFIGASRSEPHTSDVYRDFVYNMCRTSYRIRFWFYESVYSTMPSLVPRRGYAMPCADIEQPDLIEDGWDQGPYSIAHRSSLALLGDQSSRGWLGPCSIICPVIFSRSVHQSISSRMARNRVPLPRNLLSHCWVINLVESSTCASKQPRHLE